MLIQYYPSTLFYLVCVGLLECQVTFNTPGLLPW